MIKNIVVLMTIGSGYRVILVIGIIVFSALLDAVGVASILPFISVLTNPEILESNMALRSAYEISQKFGIETSSQFTALLALIVFSILIFSLSVKSLSMYMQVKFAFNQEYLICSSLMEKYLGFNYAWFQDQNGTELGKNILSEVNSVIQTAILPSLMLIAQTAVSLAIIVVLFAVSFSTAITAISVLGAAYVILFAFVKKRLSREGDIRFFSNEKRFKSVTEVFSAIKLVKIANLEKYYLDKFRAVSKDYVSSQANAQILSLLPRYVVEAIAFGGLLLLIFVLIINSIDFINILPMLSLYVLAGYRLMPALQQIFTSNSQLRFARPTIDKLIKALDGGANKNSGNFLAAPKFQQSIKLIDVDYYSPKVKSPILKNVNLEIKKGEKVGIIGKSGSGKTTLVDIILNLLKPDSGKIMIDKKNVSFGKPWAWGNLLGYVPQEVFMTDGSIQRNIALGVSDEKINQQKIDTVISKAQLGNFLNENKIADSEHCVGEMGKRLSGGQKQRIGIARALYHSPEILVLDESTSGLDQITQKQLLDELFKNSKDLTVIMVTHRLEALKYCDVVYEVVDNTVRKIVV